MIVIVIVVLWALLVNVNAQCNATHEEHTTSTSANLMTTELTSTKTYINNYYCMCAAAAASVELQYY